MTKVSGCHVPSNNLVIFSISPVVHTMICAHRLMIYFPRKNIFNFFNAILEFAKVYIYIYMYETSIFVVPPQVGCSKEMVDRRCI